MVRVIFIFIYLCCRNPKFFQKDLLICFCKILNNSSEQLMMSSLYTLLCEQLFLCSTSSCSFSQPQVLLLGCTQGLCQSHSHTMLGPRLMWSPCLLWKHPGHSYLDHFRCYLLTKAVIPNKLCYESLTRYVVLIFVLQLQEKTTGSRVQTRHSFCPWWTLCPSRGLMDSIISWQCFMIHPFPAVPQYLVSPRWALYWIGDTWHSRVLSLPAGGSY